MSEFIDHDGALRRRGVDPAIELLVHKVTKMEVSMDKMADAVTKLAIVEERQVSDRAAIERAFMAIHKTDERASALNERLIARLEKLEVATPMTDTVSKWVMDAAKWCVVAVAMFVAMKVGLTK